MALFTVEIPDKFLPGLVAELSTLRPGISPEDYFAKSAIELLDQRCAVYKVGPYYEGPVMPLYNQDGTPFRGDQNSTNASQNPEKSDTSSEIAPSGSASDEALE